MKQCRAVWPEPEEWFPGPPPATKTSHWFRGLTAGYRSATPQWLSDPDHADAYRGRHPLGRALSR